MKKKKGFTLIELLAIIVILAIIAVITVPIILNIIDNSRKGAVLDSAYGYKDAINKYYVGKLTEDSAYKIPNGTYTVNGTNGYLVGTETLEIEVSGQIPDGGAVQIENNAVKQACLKFDEYVVSINNGEVGTATKGTCNGLNAPTTTNQTTEPETNQNQTQTANTIPGMVVNGVKYYDTSWVKTNAITYHPGYVGTGNNDAIQPHKDCDGESGCRTWYPYSEFNETKNGVTYTYVNMLMNRNMPVGVRWASKDDYEGNGNNPVSPSQNSTENTVGISYPEGKTSFSAYGSYNNEKGPLTLLNKLHTDTDSWNLPLRTDSYTPASNSHSNYTIDYSGYKARLISAEEIALITRKNTAENPNEWGISNTQYFSFGALENKGYNDQSSEQKEIQQSYSWLFDYTANCTSYGCTTSDGPSGYWTSSPYTNSSGEAWVVYFTGSLDYDNFYYETAYGLRPVITVLKSDVIGDN